MTKDRSFNEALAVAALASVDGMGPGDVKILLDHFGRASSVFKAPREQLAGLLSRKRHPSALAEAILRFKDFSPPAFSLEKAVKMGINFLVYGLPGYPENLKNIPDPPPILYVRGRIEENDKLAVGIVGTRKPSPYGMQVTNRLSGALASSGVTVVSGLAMGIDAEAHRAALNAGGRTIAVMGTGHHEIYPRQNRKLADEIIERGALVTEYPLGEEALKWHFRARNRIIAGLSLGVAVTEAPLKSGALITAGFALDYNRTVYSIPGNINSAGSQGCNRLIADGAVPVMEPKRILEDLPLPVKADARLKNEKLCPRYRQIIEILEPDGQVPDIVIEKSGLMPPAVNGLLLEMELLGLVRRLPGNIYISCR